MNDVARFGPSQVPRAQTAYNYYTGSKESGGLGAGKASQCVKCGACEKDCPQHLPIRALLEDVAKKFEQ